MRWLPFSRLPIRLQDLEQPEEWMPVGEQEEGALPAFIVPLLPPHSLSLAHRHILLGRSDGNLPFRVSGLSNGAGGWAGA